MQTMFSLRTFARALPTSVVRSRASVSTRAFSLLRRPATVQPWRATALSLRYPAFSTSLPRSAELTTESEVNQELSASLASELELEKESTEGEGLPASLQEFIDNSGFTLTDQPGSEEVVLAKSFGNEKITVTFSVADLNSEHDPDNFMQDQALQDENFDADLDAETPGKKPINAGSTQQFDTAPEDSLAVAGQDGAAEAGADELSFPCNINITIEKEGVEGAMHFVTSANDGQIMIDRFAFFPSAAQADAKTAEHQWASRNVYSGPPFVNLDERLQEILERYLDERGINTALALWIPEYIDYKEQQEYMGWLANTKAFVDA